MLPFVIKIFVLSIFSRVAVLHRFYNKKNMTTVNVLKFGTLFTFSSQIKLGDNYIQKFHLESISSD